MSLRASDAVGGAPIRVVAKLAGGKPAVNAEIGIDLLTTKDGKSLFEDGIRTDASGVATLDPAADYLGRFGGKAHYYRAFPSGDILGKSDQGYCTDAKAIAAFSYSDLASLPASATDFTPVLSAMISALENYRPGGAAAPDALIRLCVAFNQRLYQFDRSTNKSVIAQRQQLGRTGMDALSSASFKCSNDPKAAATSLRVALIRLQGR